ncbi:hypothetical protein [Azospirillum endophyticum]
MPKTDCGNRKSFFKEVFTDDHSGSVHGIGVVQILFSKSLFY